MSFLTFLEGEMTVAFRALIYYFRFQHPEI
jgi:hypothetical protein